MARVWRMRTAVMAISVSRGFARVLDGFGRTSGLVVVVSHASNTTLGF